MSARDSRGYAACPAGHCDNFYCTNLGCRLEHDDANHHRNRKKKPSPDPIAAILAVKCPIKSCGAAKGYRCDYDSDRSSYYFHEARIRAALTGKP